MPGFDGRLILLAAALLLAAGSVRADYKQDYARGQEAAADGNWADVERYMQEAMSGSTTPAARVRLYGQRFAPYVPQYYLGLAAFRTNQCAEAMRWFNDPQAAAVIAQIPDMKGVADDARQQCRTVATPDPKPTTPPVEPQKPVVTNDLPPTQSLPTKPTPPPVVPKPPPSTPAPPLSQPTTTAVPAALTQALGDYLAGRFSAAGRANTAGVTGKARAHLHLVRAASLFALAETGTAQAESLRNQAQQDVRAAKQSQAGLQPDAQYFSPRFRAFFAAN